MSARFDCTDPVQRSAGLAEATAAVSRGELVVLPTDTVYGVAADAFSPVAVAALLNARSASRNMPPTVLVGTVRAGQALVENLGAFGQDLIDEFWPGPLTLIFRATPTLHWDLGETLGTVSVRMPMHPITLELLRKTGPLAVSAASRRGFPAATTVAEAESHLGAVVSVYLDDGRCADTVPSTILDLTGSMPKLLRAGVITIDELRKVVPVIDLPDLAQSGRQAADVPGLTSTHPPKPAAPHPLDGAAPHPLDGGDAVPGS